jgi:hypothetical protein
MLLVFVSLLCVGFFEALVWVFDEWLTRVEFASIFSGADETEEGSAGTQPCKGSSVVWVRR